MNILPRLLVRRRFFYRLTRSRWLWIIILILVVTILAFKLYMGRSASQNMARLKAQGDQRPIPVTVLPAKIGDMDVNLRALGTVIPLNTVTVRSQVGGQIMKVCFKEGQVVKTGDLLVEIDRRPFEVQLMQAEGQLARDEALLANAEIDLARYQRLLAEDSIAAQQVSTQESLVRQYKGAVKTDLGQIANAKLQLIYARVTAPVSGRVGLRLIDPGNIVQPNDANGMVVITQLQPITVLFSVPQDNLPAIMRRLQSRAPMPVYAYSQDNKNLLAAGLLDAVDNQIDTSTGTIKIKAKFDNRDNKLFANQFVNVMMKIDTLRDVVIMPTDAIQRGAIGTFAYVVLQDKKVTVRPLQLGPTEGADTAVLKGLSSGEMVVTMGGDKLREGSRVEILPNGGNGASLPRSHPSPVPKASEH